MRDLPGIYKESKHALFISALHHTSSSSLEMFRHILAPHAQRSAFAPAPSALPLHSRVTLLFQFEHLIIISNKISTL